MNPRVVIDKNILGWSDKNREELLASYEAVLQVGKHPDLSQRDVDETIALYCMKHDCDLITADARAYTYFFDAGARSVRIQRRDWDKKSDQKIYLVRAET
jgi:hypothetical protein